MSYRGTNWIDPKTGKPKDAPCKFIYWNELVNRDVVKHPEVNCDGRSCDTCGFNPVVKAQRLQKIKGEVEA